MVSNAPCFRVQNDGLDVWAHFPSSVLRASPPSLHLLALFVHGLTERSPFHTEQPPTPHPPISACFLVKMDLLSATLSIPNRFTMVGTDEHPGVMVSAIHDLFKLMENKPDDVKYTVRISYVEVSQRDRTVASEYHRICCSLSLLVRGQSSFTRTRVRQSHS